MLVRCCVLVTFVGVCCRVKISESVHWLLQYSRLGCVLVDWSVLPALPRCYRELRSAWAYVSSLTLLAANVSVSCVYVHYLSRRGGTQSCWLGVEMSVLECWWRARHQFARHGRVGMQDTVSIARG